MALIASDDRAEHLLPLGEDLVRSRVTRETCRLPSGVEHMARQGGEQHEWHVVALDPVRGQSRSIEVNRGNRSHRGRKDPVFVGRNTVRADKQTNTRTKQGRCSDPVIQ